MKSLRKISLLFILIYLGGCSSVERDNPGEFNTVMAIIKGTVISEDEQPVEGATVAAFYRPNGCKGDNAEPASVSTNGNGKFDINFLIAGGRSERSCYVVEVIPSDTSIVKIPEEQEINPEFRSQPPYDTTTLTFELSSTMR
jgi:hypothetical protein